MDGAVVLDRIYGNHFMRMNYWLRDIPTWEEYGQWVTRQMDWVSVNILAPEDDTVEKSVKGPIPYQRSTYAMLHIYDDDVDLLRLFGIRFLVTDRPPKDARARRIVSETKPDKPGVHLFELPRPNVGDYSPTKVLRVENAVEAKKALLANKASLDRIAVVFEELKGTYVPTEMAVLTAERDGFRFRGKSNGRSLVLLPVQYSHCLEVVEHGAGSDPGVRIRRGNLVLTLLEFSGAADIRVHFNMGLGSQADCRKADGRDMSDFGLSP